MTPNLYVKFEHMTVYRLIPYSLVTLLLHEHLAPISNFCWNLCISYSYPHPADASIYLWLQINVLPSNMFSASECRSWHVPSSDRSFLRLRQISEFRLYVAMPRYVYSLVQLSIDSDQRYCIKSAVCPMQSCTNIHRPMASIYAYCSLYLWLRLNMIMTAPIW